MEKNRCISNEEFAKQAIDTPAAADRVRLVALDNAGTLASAKERSLRRELAIKTDRLGKDAPEVNELTERLKQQQALQLQTKAEIERGQTDAPERREDLFVLHGRVVNSQQLGQPGLTVSAVDSAGKAVVFECTDDRGYFKLEIGVEDSQKLTLVSLQVSEKSEKVLYHGDETHKVVSEGVVYREIVLGREKPVEPCPPPPKPEPQPDKVKVPNVVGKPETKAIELLKAAKLSIGDLKTEPDPERVGLVLAQDPKAGSEVPTETPVNLFIGVAKQILVPKVVGLKLKSARNKLRGSGLTVGTIKRRVSDRVDVVLDQDPEAGREVTVSTPVNLVVGSAQVG